MTEPTPAQVATARALSPCPYRHAAPSCHAVRNGQSCSNCERVPRFAHALAAEAAAARRAGIEEAATKARAKAAEIKHTSHRDGLGMGDMRRELCLVDFAHDLERALLPPTEGPAKEQS